MSSTSDTVEDRLTALRQIAQQSPDLHGRVSEALNVALRDVLANDRELPSSARYLRTVIKGRIARNKVFDTELFRDPAWDMMLDLYDAHLSGRVTSVSSLCIAAQVPATTGLRYIAAMEREGFVTRRRDTTDQRRVLIEATPGTIEAMEKMARRFALAY